MKKPAFYAVFIFTVCMLTFFGCSGSKTLSRPEITGIDDNYILTWAPVAGAREYILEINNTAGGESDPVNMRRTSYSLSDREEGSYKIRIKAVAANPSVKDSDWSDVTTFYRPYETGCIYALVNGNTEYQVLKAGSASGTVFIEDEYRGKPVTAIADNAFKNNMNVESIVVGNNVKTIGDYAFSGCSKLTSITLPESLTEIGTRAFYNSRIQSIAIPKYVTAIKEYTFAHCANLTEVVFNGNNIATIDEHAFSASTALQAIEIPDSVVSIGQYAFDSNTELTSVTFGKNLTQIDDYAFYACSALKEIKFAKEGNLTKIGSFAFSNCIALGEIRLPDGLKSIGDSTFFESEALKEVIIPDSVTGVGSNAFNKTKLYYNAIEDGKKIIYADNWLVHCTAEFKKNTTTIVASTFENDEIVGIANEVFRDCEILRQITFPKSLKFIGEYAFTQVGLVQKEITPTIYRVEIPANSVEVIGVGAFSNCTSLSVLLLNEGIVNIGEYAFYNCFSLSNNESLIPASVTSIGVRAFYKTALWESPNYEGVVYAGNWVVGFNAENVQQVSFREGTAGISDYAFYACTSLFTINGISYVKYIGFAAFYGCTSLTYIIDSLSEELTEIKGFTFFNCSSLDLIVLPAGLKSIGQSAFYLCESLEKIDFSGTDVETIADYAFYGCFFMTEVVFGEKLKSIGEYAFYKCMYLANLEIPGSVVSIGIRAFAKCTSLKTLTIRPGLVEIGNYAFYGCGVLRNVDLPASVRSIGRNAFYNCKAVTQITLSEGLEVIGDYAFYGLEKITKLVIPNSVVSIGKFAFKGCNGLMSVILADSIEQVGAHAFYGCGEMTIFTDAESIPGTWHKYWNSSRRPVVLGCELSEDNTFVVSVLISDNTFLYVNATNGFSAPHCDGYIFRAWTTDGNSATEFSAKNIVDAPVGTVLYSAWNEAEN